MADFVPFLTGTNLPLFVALSLVAAWLMWAYYLNKKGTLTPTTTHEFSKIILIWVIFVLLVLSIYAPIFIFFMTLARIYSLNELSFVLQIVLLIIATLTIIAVSLIETNLKHTNLPKDRIKSLFLLMYLADVTILGIFIFGFGIIHLSICANLFSFENFLLYLLIYIAILFFVYFLAKIKLFPKLDLINDLRKLLGRIDWAILLFILLFCILLMYNSVPRIQNVDEPKLYVINTNSPDILVIQRNYTINNYGYFNWFPFDISNITVIGNYSFDTAANTATLQSTVIYEPDTFIVRIKNPSLYNTLNVSKITVKGIKNVSLEPYQKPYRAEYLFGSYEDTNISSQTRYFFNLNFTNNASVPVLWNSTVLFDYSPVWCNVGYIEKIEFTNNTSLFSYACNEPDYCSSQKDGFKSTVLRDGVTFYTNLTEVPAKSNYVLNITVLCNKTI